mgnify:CR=1 FL=1
MDDGGREHRRHHPETMARINSLIPVKLEGNTLTVAIADPLDYNVIRNVEVYTGHVSTS